MSLQIEPENDTWKVICQKCQHFERVDKASAEKYDNDPESFHCELCFIPKGDNKIRLRKFIHCAECNQTFDSKSSCDCSIQASSIEIVYDPKNKWMKKDWNKDYASYNAKTTLDFNKHIRNRKLEQEERQIRVDKNLEKTVELLGKLVKQKEKKGAV